MRFWILRSPTDDNRLAEVEATANMDLVCIVDEDAGGVIGYVSADLAEGICLALNYSASVVVEEE